MFRRELALCFADNANLFSNFAPTGYRCRSEIDTSSSIRYVIFPSHLLYDDFVQVHEVFNVYVAPDCFAVTHNFGLALFQGTPDHFWDLDGHLVERADALAKDCRSHDDDSRNVVLLRLFDDSDIGGALDIRSLCLSLLLVLIDVAIDIVEDALLVVGASDRMICDA